MGGAVTEIPWMRLFQLNHHFRAVSVAVGDRRRPLRGWRLFGYIGEHQGPIAGAAVLHGPWRPTQAAALRAVYHRAIRTGRLDA